MLASIDILGQQLMFTRLYTQISLTYSVTDESSYLTIVDKLTKGLEQLVAAFPWVAGKVEDCKIIPYLDHCSISQLIKVKDYRQDTTVPTMEEYRKAKFPLRMFDEATVAPCKTASYFDFMNKESPVLLIQVNYIQGGLILTFNANHQVMDMIGQAEIMSLLSKACHEGSFTEEEITIGNLDRENIIPLLNEEEQKKISIDHQVIKPSTSVTPPPTPPSCQWANFMFEKDSLDQLKSIASKDLLDGVDYISTDDALTAFIWQSITKARLPRLQQQLKDEDLLTKVSKMGRAIDVRKFLDIPSNFIGTIQNMTYHQYPIQELGSSSSSLNEKNIPLGHIASNLRSGVHPKTSTLKQKTRELATLLSITKDKSAISTTATLDLSTDLTFSSWSKVNCYSLDFNLGLGLPESVIRPFFPPFESIIFFSPKSLKGDVVANICLRDEDMNRLINDHSFIKYGQYLN